jgi:hypothetical protein
MTGDKQDKTLPRIEALREAARIVAGDRDVQYGAPEDNLGRIAKIWSVIFGIEISAQDVAMAMIGLKMARFVNKGEFQPDTWIDIAGYAGIGFEVHKLDEMHKAATSDNDKTAASGPAE